MQSAISYLHTPELVIYGILCITNFLFKYIEVDILQVTGKIAVQIFRLEPPAVL